MRKIFLAAVLTLAGFTGATYGQRIAQSEVPSVIVNLFQQTYSKAYDVEWKIDGASYKVEFELGLGIDHDVWYDKSGGIVRQKTDISKNDLPAKVLSKINSDFSGYRVDDAEKINEGSKTTYLLELKKQPEEWKILFDSEGNVLEKIAD